MTKERKSQKEAKKKPTLTLKEKRNAKNPNRTQEASWGVQADLNAMQEGWN